MNEDYEIEEEVETVKPGYKTTEFWLSAVAAIVGILLTSGVLVEGNSITQVVGIIATALSAMGYSVSRGNAKKYS